MTLPDCPGALPRLTGRTPCLPFQPQFLGALPTSVTSQLEHVLGRPFLSPMWVTPQKRALSHLSLSGTRAQPVTLWKCC